MNKAYAIFIILVSLCLIPVRAGAGEVDGILRIENQGPEVLWTSLAELKDEELSLIAGRAMAAGGPRVMVSADPIIILWDEARAHINSDINRSVGHGNRAVNSLTAMGK